MRLAWVLAWIATQQLGPQVPGYTIGYLGPPPGQHGGQRAAGDIAGLVTVPAAKATAVLFKGGFAYGGTASVEAALDAAPGVTTVAFDSPGGRIGVADGIAQLIHSRHLATAVTRYCASACTIAYVAGGPRVATPTALFAFHLGEAPILTDTVAAAAVLIEQPWFVRGHVSLDFANRALHAPNGTPYIPRLDELVAAGYVTAILPPPPLRADTPRASPLFPLMEAVRQLEPATAYAITWGSRQLLVREGDADATADTAELRIGLVVNRWFGRTSDAAALGIIDARLAVMDALGTANPKACLQWQVGVEDQVAGLQAIPAPLRARLRAAQVAVLRDAATVPQAVPTDRETLSTIDRSVRDGVKQTYGQRALIDAATREHAFDDPAKSCAAEAAYLRGLRNQPDAGRLLRWALAAG